MLKYFLILYGLTCIIIFGCSSVLKMVSGVRDIRVESVEELKLFCSENSIDLNNTFIYKPDSIFNYPDSSHINFRFADQVLVFNKNGNRIIYKGEQTGNYCSLPQKDFFSGLHSIFLPLDTVNNLSFLLKDFKNIKTYKLPNINDQADFYLIYYWSNWYKSFTKRSIESIQSILSNADTSTIVQPFYLNNDFVVINYPDDLEFKKLKIKVSF